MTLRIEKEYDGQNTTIRLIGRIQAEHIEGLKAQISEGAMRVKLDMNEVTLVDVDVVRFLGTCQGQGIEIVHCAPYIHDWIANERKSPSR